MAEEAAVAAQDHLHTAALQAVHLRVAVIAEAAHAHQAAPEAATVEAAHAHRVAQAAVEAQVVLAHRDDAK